MGRRKEKGEENGMEKGAWTLGVFACRLSNQVSLALSGPGAAPQPCTKCNGVSDPLAG